MIFSAQLPFPGRLPERRLVKICGNRFAADVFLVASAGPDIMGWIFSPKSPRRIPVDLAARLLHAVRREHPGIRHAGVFARNSLPEILSIDAALHDGNGPLLDLLQIVEGPGLLTSLAGHARLRQRIVPVLRLARPVTDLDFAARGNHALYLMDAYVPGRPGGTGHRLAPEFVAGVRRPFLLAGGLNPANVVDALRQSGAAGADVSSGLEVPGQPGRKDPALVRDFVLAVKSLSPPGH